MVTQVNTLRVEMDSTNYEAGVQKVEAGSKTAAAAANSLAASIAGVKQADARVSDAGDWIEKLKRRTVDGYGAMATLNGEVTKIAKAFELGRLSSTEMNAALDGAIRRSGQLADVSQLLAKGQMDAARAAELANQRFQQQRNSMVANSNVRQMNTFNTANIAAQFQDIAVTSAMGMSPMQIALQQGTQLSMALGEAGAAGAVRALGGAFLSLLNPVSLATIGFTAATAAAIQYFTSTKDEASKTTDILKEHQEAIRAAAQAWGDALPSLQSYSNTVDRLAKFQTGQDGTQAFIKQAFANLPGPMDSLTNSFLVATRSIDQTDLDPNKFRALLSTFANLRMEVAHNTANMSDLWEAQRALSDAMSSNAAPKLKEYATAFDKVTASIRMAVEEAKRATREFYTAISGADNVQDIISGNTFRDDQGGIQYTRTFMPKNPPTPTLRPDFDLNGDPDKTAAKTESAYQTLLRASNQRLGQLQNEIAISGQAADVQARLRAEYEAQSQYLEAIARTGGKVNEQELAALREKAALQARLNTQLAGTKFDQGQADQIAQLQLQASLIGKSAAEQARANAVFQAEQQMRQQGLSLLGQEADRRRAVAAAIADATTEIQRQQQAFTSLQQVQGSVIDDLLAGTGSFKERMAAALGDVMKWLNELAVTNPLKNALTGTNLPTLQDLFSGKPAVPAANAMNTGTMTVTAATVMINGAPVGGFPAAPGSLPGLGSVINPGSATTPTQTTLGSFLGLNYASQVGVRPTLTPGGIVNSPVPLTVANQNTPADMLAYQNAIKSIESGGRYDIMGPVLRSGDRAYGAYQVMGNNVPSWTERWYGQRLTPDQFLANRQAQDSVFNGEFGSYVDRYGASGAASKWFTGSATPTGRTDILGTSDNQYVNQFNAALRQANSNLASTSKDVSTLGNNSTDAGKSIMDAFGQNSTLTKAVTPAVTQPQVVQPAVAPPTSGFNPFSLFTGLFSLFGFADGTDYAPGGRALVGERGPEIVNLPRGSQVIPNHRLNSGNGAGRTVNVKHEYTINVQGNGDKELMDRMQAAAEETVRSGITNYDHNILFKRIGEYQNDPYAVGA